MELELTRGEHRALVAALHGKGHWPKLTRPGDKPCPAEVGDQHRIAQHAMLTVVELRRSRKGEHVLHYEVQAEEQDRFLAPAGRGVPATPGGRQRMNDDEAHGYTTNSARALDRDAPAVSHADQLRLSEQAAARAAQRRAVERARRERLDLADRLRRARHIAERRGVDISKHERALERRLLELERLLDGEPRQAV